MKRTFLNLIFIDTSVAAALLHLGEKENRIRRSLLACYNHIISIVPSYQEIQETNSVLTQTGPRVATSEVQRITFNSAAQLSSLRHAIKLILPVLNILSLFYAVSSQN